MATPPRTARPLCRIVLDIGPLTAVTVLLFFKLVYFSALLPGQWWLLTNDWHWGRPIGTR